MDGTEDDQMWEDDSNCDPFAGVAEDEDVDLLYVDSFEQQQAEIDPESYENLFEDSDSEDYYDFYAQTMARPWPRLLPTFKAWLLSTCLIFFFFQCRRNFNFMACFEVIILKNRIERAF